MKGLSYPTDTEVCFDCILVLCFIMGYGLQFGETAYKRFDLIFYEAQNWSIRSLPLWNWQGDSRTPGGTPTACQPQASVLDGGGAGAQQSFWWQLRQPAVHGSLRAENPSFQLSDGDVFCIAKNLSKNEQKCLGLEQPFALSSILY